MKLALVISSLAAGGAERVMSTLANYWAARGHDVSVFTIDSSDVDFFPLDSRVRRAALGLRRDSTGIASAILNNVRRISALRRALRASGARVIVSFGEFTNVQALCASRWTAIRCIVSERTDPRRHQVGWMWRFLRRLTYPMADALVVQTQALLPWARSIVGSKRAHVVPNPVRDMGRADSGSARGRRRIVIAVGRLVPAKGFDILLEAFARISRDAPDWRLVILGDGPERDKLSELARTLHISDRVALPGWSAEPVTSLAQAGMFVLPSRYEGFPNALLEAMACGLPVIVSACTGAAAIVSHEHDGLIIDVESVSQLSAAMKRLIEDQSLRDRLGRQAAEVSSRYKVEAVAQQWERIIGTGLVGPSPLLQRGPAGTP